jgi:hypothetical protein
MPVAVTIPVDEPTTATDEFEVDHVPPPVALVRVLVPPTQYCNTPEIVAGIAPTDTIVVRLHVVGNVYVISAVPVVMPVTTPLIEPTVATAVLPLAHVPPVVLDSVIEAPTQTGVLSDINDGSGFTVISLVT